MAKNSPYQNFHGIYSMIGSPERVKIPWSSIQKIRKIHSCVWKFIGQKLSKQSILAKNGQILVLNGQNFAISEFSRHIEYDFLKVDYKNNLPKIKKIHNGVWKLLAQNSKIGLKWTKFCYFMANKYT